MNIVNRWIAGALALLMAFPPALSAQENGQPKPNILTSKIDYSVGADAWPHITAPYRTPFVPDIDLSNSPRLDNLLRDGRLYLSLADAIALTIENNLDVATARYGPKVADTDILRSKAGGQLRGVQTQIGTLSTGTSAAGGGGGGGGDATGITGRAGGGGDGGGGVGAIGDASTFFGSSVPALDPVVQTGIDWGHFSNPQTSDFVTGTNTFITESSNSFIAYRQAFLTGTSVSLAWANRLADTNSRRNNFNPSLRSNITLQVRQPLLQGFDIASNSRNIHVAKNNRQVSDLAFKQQVISSVTRVINLYWDLVSFIEDVRGREEDLRLAEKLYEDNKRRVEIGTLAPIEIVRAEAEVAARQQVLTVAVTRVQLQETIIKNAISTNGVASPSVMESRIVPTDQIDVPTTEPIRPLQDLMGQALKSRPEIAQSLIQLENREIALTGVKNAMLPSLDVVADVTNNGLAGEANENFIDDSGTGNIVNPFFLGGLGTSMGQIFRRNFPDYSIGVQLRIPLRNRTAQADYSATLLEQRQATIRIRQLENSIRVEVQNAVIGLQQARAQLEAAQKTRILQEQTLDAEQKKFNLGASTIFQVVQAQRDLALSRSAEVAAQNGYVKAKVDLHRATGDILEENNVFLEEAYRGQVSRPHDPIPPSQAQP